LTGKHDRHKQPSFEGSAPPGRDPRAGEDLKALMRQTPLWCFRHLDARGSEWSWEADSDLDSKVIKALERLKALAGTNWMVIEHENGRKSNGSIEIAKLAKEAQERIRVLKLEQFDPFYHLRVEKAVRIWGYRIERVLYIVWLDRKHTVYPTLEK
jgi:hypothetical protein